MGLGTRFDPGVIGTPLSVVGGLLDELVGALAKSAKGCEGDGLEADVQVLLLNDLVRAAILLGGHLVRCNESHNARRSLMPDERRAAERHAMAAM